MKGKIDIKEIKEAVIELPEGGRCIDIGKLRKINKKGNNKYTLDSLIKAALDKNYKISE